MPRVSLQDQEEGLTMMPIGPLMIEHRWIERVIAALETRLDRRRAEETIDPHFVEQVVDFLRTYADRCHHGKEEDILFRDLEKRDLEPALAATMAELVRDHEWARATTRRLVAANADAAGGDRAASSEVVRLLGDLASFYPAHIQKEDDRFFRQVMTYLTASEQAAMLDAFSRFDASLIHERYRRIAQELETG
jgi:hemerythrin-like domain-containing protein